MTTTVNNSQADSPVENLENKKTKPPFWKRVLEKKNRDKAKEKPAKQVIDKRRIDYRYAQDNPFLFIKGDSVWTGVILSTTSDDFASFVEEETTIHQRTAALRDLSTHFENTHNMPRVRIHLITRFVPIDVSRWEKQFLDSRWEPSELFLDLVQKHVSPHLAETTPERRQYLLIRLGDFKAKTQLDPVSKLLGESAAVSEEVFNGADLEPFRAMARGVHAVMASNHGAIPMERTDLSWIIRNILMGHFPAENGTGVERSRPWRGGYFDEIANSDIENCGHYLRIRNPHPHNGLGEFSYSTTLTATYRDPMVPYNPSAAWGKLLRSMPRPVNVSWRGDILSASEWKKTAKRDIRRLNGEAEERVKHNARSSASFSQKMQMVNMLEDELETNPQPVFISQQRLTFAAPAPEDLTIVTGQLQSAFGDSIKLERSQRFQGFLLEEQLPGDMANPNKKYQGLGRMVVNDLTGGFNDEYGSRITDLEAVAFARLDSSPSVGDEVEYRDEKSVLGWRGIPIGYNPGNGAVVHFDPINQLARNNGAGVAILGSSGGGKSSLALTLFFWCSEAGIQCIVMDPKNDFQAFVYYLCFGDQTRDPDFDVEAKTGVLGTPKSKFKVINQQFWDETSMVHLGNGVAGMLDPWAITETYAEGETAARMVTKLLFNSEEHKIVDIAYQKMRDVCEKTGQKPSLADLGSFLGEEMEMYRNYEENEESDVSARMQAHKHMVEVRRVYDALLRAQERRYGKLMFGRAPENTRPFSLKEKDRRVVITMLGLAKPKAGSNVSDWDEDTCDGAAALMSVIRLVEKLFSTAGDQYSHWRNLRSTRPRLLFVDEGYYITAFPAGQDMLDRFARQGRSMFFGIVFISQQAKDLNAISKKSDDEADQNQFPSVFVFRQQGLQEASDAMKLLRPSLKNNEGDLNQLSRQLLKPADGGIMQTGLAVMSDVDSRVSTVQIDRMFDELVSAAETNANSRAQTQSRPISANGADWHINTAVRDRLRTGIVTQEMGDIREAIARTNELDEYSDLPF